jgi:hypothetical protein
MPENQGIRHRLAVFRKQKNRPLSVVYFLLSFAPKRSTLQKIISQRVKRKEKLSRGQ